eukprot:TRINITY_DN5401_c0_g1_i7.p1 TRINITY_DN5401_c0_g1~~TRINITY_DN5401_c0_g1_i7.p1  ORF type:complete len:459 (+),score=55.03 TRINITY_DN5401_c0_g1_i7:343-1719(+)
MSQLFMVFMNGNVDLGVNISMLRQWPLLQQTSFTDCTVQGQLSPDLLSAATSLRILLLDNVGLSGTIPEQFFESATQLSVVELSNNKLSGTLPLSLTVLSTLTAFLANSNRLEGTLPHSSTASWLHSLETLSLARNYFVGNTEALAHSSSLETLVLSGNLLGCNLVRLDNAKRLGSGQFQLPTTVALEMTGLQLTIQNALNRGSLATAIKATYFIGNGDPFAHVVRRAPSRPNSVLLFPGNAALTTDASVLSGTSAPRSLREDEVMRGRMGIFSGPSPFYTFLCLLVPLLSLAHLLVIVLGGGVHQTQAVGRRLRRYCTPRINADGMLSGACFRLLRDSFYPSCMLMACGVSAAVWNLASPSIYHAGCIDFLTNTTIAPTRTGMVYQWIWCCIMCALMLITARLAQKQASDHSKARAMLTHRHLCEFAKAAWSPERQSIAVWQPVSYTHLTLPTKRIV